MISKHFPFLKSIHFHSPKAIFRLHRLVFFVFIVLVVVAAAAAAANMRHRSRDAEEEQSIVKTTTATHSNFFRSNLRGRDEILNCCFDREKKKKKNPWGGRTCCFQRFCKDTRNDPNHCGECGKTCGFGQTCCNGNCVDTQSDPYNCGACFEVCPVQTKCTYSMCDYAA